MQEILKRNGYKIGDRYNAITTLNRMSKVELRRRKYGYNDFEFSMTADLSKFMKLNIKKQRQENGNDNRPERDYILEPQDWHMYLCILHLLKTNAIEKQIGDIVTIDRRIFFKHKALKKILMLWI